MLLLLCRPTEQAHWWEDEPNILAGRDKVKRGTWLAFSRAGRFAFLTNFREARPLCIKKYRFLDLSMLLPQQPFGVQVKHDAVTEGPGRGALPISFVKGTQPPLEFLKGLQAEVRRYV